MKPNDMQDNKLRNLILVAFFGLCIIVIALVYARKGGKDPVAAASASASVASSVAGKPTGPSVEILVSTSDGKKEWIEDVAKAFEASGATAGGKSIKIKLLHMKSGESMQAILDGKEKPTLWSPASGSWNDLINTTWKTRTGHPFVENAKPTVVSPLVLAMWEPMAKALGWPAKPIGWEEVFKVASDPKGWGSYGHPEWGPFRFGHAHPDYSTSAMLSVVSSIYAAAGKSKGLTVDDMKDQKIIDKVGALERGIVHYGESSSFLTDRLCIKGPAYLSAVPLYESSVVAANDKYKAKLPFPLVAVFPKEGTFWEDHPAGVVQGDWVTADMKEAGEKFVAFMTSKEQQTKALKYGYRPTDPSIAITSPVDEAHGADPKQTSATKLEYVSEDVFRRANELWHQVKKHSTVFLVLDVSGSMQGEPMAAAKKGAAAFVRAMEKEDEIAVIAFSTNVRLIRPMAKVRDVGEGLAKQVEELFADGGTALHDAIIEAMGQIDKHKKASTEPRLYGVVVLTDGQDTSSKKTRQDLMDLMPATETAEGTRLFTVAYGTEADKDFLKQIADRSNARYLEGNAGNIGKLYHQISAYF